MRYLALVLLVGGCASSIDAQVPKLVGQPVDSIVAKIGLPTSERTIMGKHVYSWVNTEQVTDLAPIIGGGSRLVLTPVATVGTCTVDLVVDAGGIVRGADWQGDREACSRYTRRLKQG